MRIGYTTGVFDMFHVGHLNLLTRAKNECDRLIVGVSTDELCESGKKKKPIIPLEERMAIVGAIRYVDEVVIQEDYDKIAAWEKIRFNVMFVGDDWKGSDRWVRLEDEFNKLGVDIIYFPYTRQTSSTLLREVLFDEKK